MLGSSFAQSAQLACHPERSRTAKQRRAYAKAGSCERNTFASRGKLLCSFFIYHAKYYRGGRKQDDRYEDKYSAAHKELLWESENNSVGRGVEIPIGLAGEEKLMEYLKRAVKVHRRKRSDYTENGKRAAARIEEHIEAEELREAYHLAFC